MNQGVDAAASGRLGVDRIWLEPKQRTAPKPPENDRGKRSVSTAEVEDAAFEVGVAKNRFDLKDAPQHRGGLKQISRCNPAKDVASLSELGAAHQAGLTALCQRRKFHTAKATQVFKRLF